MILFWIGLAFLLLFSYIDLKTSKLENAWITLFLGIGLYARILVIGDLDKLTILLGIILMGLFSYGLWKFNTIGGADMKLLPTMVPWFPIFGLPSLFGVLIRFTIILGILGLLYSILMRSMAKRKKKVPFIPVITLAYIASWIFRVY